jgi:hypothetical protein
MMLSGAGGTMMVIVPFARCVAGGIRLAQAACSLVVCWKNISYQSVWIEYNAHNW